MTHSLNASIRHTHDRFAQMRKRRAGLMVLLAATSMSFASCTNSDSASNPADLGASETDKLQVVTTFLPITNFTMAVAGDRAEVTQLLPLNVGPHDYQAKPQDVQRLAEADVLVENGLEMEEFLSGIIDSADNPDLIRVDSSEGIDAIPMAEGAHEGDDHHEAHDDEDHSDEAHDDEEHDDEVRAHESHDDEEHADEDAHAHGEFDPHIWLDPKKAIQQVGNIRDALVAADPAGEEIYTANADAYVQQLEQLDARISAALAPYADQTFVSYHDFADHFSQSYDIEVEHLVGVPEDSATPADMQRVAEAVEGSDLRTLLQEPAQQGGSLSALAKDMNLQVSEFDPMESSGPEGLSPDYYLETMAQNLENLETAFAQAAR